MSVLTAMTPASTTFMPFKAPSQMPKAKATSAIATPQATGSKWTPLNPDPFAPPKKGVFKKAVSLMNSAMPVVLDKLHAASRNALFVTRAFFGDFPDFVPEVIENDHYASSSSSSFRSRFLDKLPNEIEFTHSFTAFKVDRNRKGVNLHNSLQLAIPRLFKRRPAQRIARFLNTLENQPVSHDATKTTFKPTVRLTTYLTEDPANYVPRVCSPDAPGSAVRKPTTFPTQTQQPWQKVNFEFYEKLASKTFDTIEGDTTSSAEELAHRLRTLYRVLESQMVHQVRANFVSGGQKMLSFNSRISRISGHLRALFMELDLINEDYKEGVCSHLIQSRLAEVVEKLRRAKSEVDFFKKDLDAAFGEPRLVQMLAEARECVRISTMVTLRHFDLTENVKDSDGIFFADCGQHSYRRTLTDVERILPVVTDVFLTDHLHVTMRATSRVFLVVDSLIYDAERLQNFL